MVHRQWLEIVGKRIEVAGEAGRSKRLLKKLTTSEWLTELKFDPSGWKSKTSWWRNWGGSSHGWQCRSHYRLGRGRGCYSVDTDGDYIELYCEMIRTTWRANRQTVQDWMEERDRLTLELMRIKAKPTNIIDAYDERLRSMSRQIERSDKPHRLQAVVGASPRGNCDHPPESRNRSSRPLPKVSRCGKPKPSAS